MESLEILLEQSKLRDENALRLLREKRKAAGGGTSLTDALMVLSNLEDRRNWEKTITNDEREQRSVQLKQTSANFRQGPNQKLAALVKVLTVASAQCNVTLPKSALRDLSQTKLPEMYADLKMDE